MPKKKEDTKKNKDKLLAALEECAGLVSFACKKTGLSRQTFYRWCKEDPEFKQKVEDVMERQVDVVEAKLLKKINDEDTTAIIFYLKTKGKHRGYTQKVEIAPDDDVLNIQKAINGLTDEQRKVLLSLAENHKIEDD
ncbi:MAG: hypothetical protein LIP01_05960 [Tannerellaceae bacterium]|nr:hypothetical protein [Tannerellaceae bacterium]